MQFQVTKLFLIIKQLETNGENSRPALGISMVNLSSVNNELIKQLNLPRDVKGGVVIAKSWRKVVQKQRDYKHDVIVEMDGQKFEGIQKLT